MSTCNQLDLQTLESQPIMPKNLPNHWPVLKKKKPPVVMGPHIRVPPPWPPPAMGPNSGETGAAAPIITGEGFNCAQISKFCQSFF